LHHHRKPGICAVARHPTFSPMRSGSEWKIVIFMWRAELVLTAGGKGGGHPAVAVIQTDDELLEYPPGLLLCQASHGAVTQRVLQGDVQTFGHQSRYRSDSARTRIYTVTAFSQYSRHLHVPMHTHGGLQRGEIGCRIEGCQRVRGQRAW